MIAAARKIAGRVFGRAEASITVPILDGPLKANDRLEQAERIAEIKDVDNLARAGSEVFCSSGRDLRRLMPGQAAIETFEKPISCLAASPAGALAVGLDGEGIVVRGGPHDGKRITHLDGDAFLCPTAVLFLDETVLIAANGSRAVTAADWKRDLLDFGRSGSLWRIDLAGGTAQRLADHLAFPNGLARAGSSQILVSEAWRHRVLAIPREGGPAKIILADLAGYPARIAPAASGGYFLGLFAPRNQLVELVLRETAYRRRMMAECGPDDWIAPALSSGVRFEEPLQGGAVKQMGVLKPWAPSFSYGLVVRCDADMQPVSSYHSRAGGRVHGVTALCESETGLLVAARGAGMVVRLATHEGAQS